MQARGPGQRKTQQGWAMANFSHASKALAPVAKQARADRRKAQKRELAHLYLA